MAHITGLDVYDVRFPTSRELHGSDAVNVDPDYSAAYLVLRTDDGVDGYGLVFTCGRGTEVVVAAIRALAHHVVGRDVGMLCSDLGGFGRALIADGQLRWLGPEKGVLHMAIGGLVNAAWDLAARREGKPLWQLLAGMSPDELVAAADFRYISDALTLDEALDLLRAAYAGRAGRERTLRAEGYPAYATTPGWLGYSDDRLASLSAEAVGDGFDLIKLKVGGKLPDDVRRMGIAREVVGDDVRLATDANQRWSIDEAVAWMQALAPFDPWWIEEPTSPDDVLGHAEIRRGVAPIKVATGEHVQNRIIVKQLLQAEAVDILQIDACRVAGVNENIAILLLAAKFGVPVCPHAGGVGLCELVQHLAMFDFVAVSGSMEGRVIEYVDHLHEHFTDPVTVRNARYVAPNRPGFSAEMLRDSVERYGFPAGAQWTGVTA